MALPEQQGSRDRREPSQDEGPDEEAGEGLEQTSHPVEPAQAEGKPCHRQEEDDVAQ